MLYFLGKILDQGLGFGVEELEKENLLYVVFENY